MATIKRHKIDREKYTDPDGLYLLLKQIGAKLGLPQAQGYGVAEITPEYVLLDLQEQLAGRLWLSDGMIPIPKPQQRCRQEIMGYIWKLRLHRVSLPPEFKRGKGDASWHPVR